ncbi:hypothetical protein Mpt1_c07570 [Candidatus Methanoplasma termitum]|uniref:Uncharacterized protein YyaB-like PH domain-containing protein n=1 Tax=Candidatus Methanoplasma termitum TaxID=1577791 RepID=A0A0A7LBX0_9ARCH|nr:PH domain-containing protein [Candidatus Methanoplasma termitum]AIZ56640.1 hypothetical protein Mpt1_c07570 [Candidatus Methanoplasma termitum]
MPSDTVFRAKLKLSRFVVFTMVRVYITLGVAFVVLLYFSSETGDYSTLFIIVALFLLAAACFPFLFAAVFYFRVRYILKQDRLVLNLLLKKLEIRYSAIKRVEETIEKGASGTIEISFINHSGGEDKVRIRPAEKQEFLLKLRSRIPDRSVFK